MNDTNESPGHLDPGIPTFQGDIRIDQVPAVDGTMLAVITFQRAGDKRSYPIPLDVAKIIGEGLVKVAQAGRLTIAKGSNGHV